MSKTKISKELQERNADRAARALATLKHYNTTFHASDSDHETALTDLLTDLRHLCAQEKISFGNASQKSTMYYQAEARGAEIKILRGEE